MKLVYEVYECDPANEMNVGVKTFSSEYFAKALSAAKAHFRTKNRATVIYHSERKIILGGFGWDEDSD